MFIENNINICIGYLKKKYLKILNEFTVKKNNRTQIYKHMYIHVFDQFRHKNSPFKLFRTTILHKKCYSFFDVIVVFRIFLSFSLENPIH